MPTIGWFDAFRENGDPTWFGDNRTPVVFDLQIFALISLFVTPLIAFLIILPGVRYYRLVSTVTFVLSMVVGAIILAGLSFEAGGSPEKIRMQDSKILTITYDTMHQSGAQV